MLGQGIRELTISTDHYPSLFFRDRAGAIEVARKLNFEYMDICLIEFNGEEIGYGLYNVVKEELVEIEDLHLYYISK